MGQHGFRTMANWFGFTKTSNLKNHLTLKDLRISKGFKISISFADACGLNPSTYSQIEAMLQKQYGDKLIPRKCL